MYGTWHILYAVRTACMQQMYTCRIAPKHYAFNCAQDHRERELDNGDISKLNTMAPPRTHNTHTINGNMYSSIGLSTSRLLLYRIVFIIFFSILTHKRILVKLQSQSKSDMCESILSTVAYGRAHYGDMTELGSCLRLSPFVVCVRVDCMRLSG